jgi:hypothetical protein
MSSTDKAAVEPVSKPAQCPQCGRQLLVVCEGDCGAWRLTHDLNPVLAEVAAERARQNAKWGQQDHPDGTARPGDRFQAEMAREICQANNRDQDNWRDILTEEVHEAYAELDPVKLRAELIQVAAVAVAWIEAIDRRSVITSA